MFINQISVFVNNEKGALSEITSILYKNDIDIRAIAIFDTPEYCICRLVTDRADEACQLIKKEGMLAKISRVLAVVPPDEKGILNEIFTAFKENEINIEYSYCFVMNRKELPYIVIKTDNQDKAAETLEKLGVRIASKEEVQRI